MKSSYYRKKWQELTAGPPSREGLRRLSRQIASSFLDAYMQGCRYEEGYISLLCEMTAHFREPDLNNIAAQALFGIIIETLCDDFEDLQIETYNRVMAQVISFCRNLPGGTELNRRLIEFGIASTEDLRVRLDAIRRTANLLSKRPLKKILLLSRVTIGADVAITSVIIQWLSLIHPEADLVLLGSAKLAEIYSGNDRVTIRPLSYERRGGILERLAVWHQVLEIVQTETAGLAPEEVALLDPDSRLSQLGVLPLIAPEHYFFFDSRSDIALNTRLSMVELTNAWLHQITGNDHFFYSKVWPSPANNRSADLLITELRAQGAARVITVNFGVGGNARKRVGRDFELKLLLTLLAEPDTVILLDKGFGPEEIGYTDSLLTAVAAQGYAVRHAAFDSTLPNDLHWGALGLTTTLGEIAALIAGSDEFIGYDSACQHIAAASETPCLTIFAGSNNMRFIRRWSAFGAKNCQLVHVDTLNNPSGIEIDDLIIRIMNERQVTP